MKNSSPVLQGITWDHPRRYAPLEVLAPEIESRFGCRIDWTRRSLRAFGDTPVTELARRFDLLIIDHPHCGQAARDGVLLPLDTLLTAAVWTAISSEPPASRPGSGSSVSGRTMRCGCFRKRMRQWI